MKRTPVSLAAGLLLAAMPLPAGAQRSQVPETGPPLGKEAADDTARMSQVIGDYVENKRFMGAVLVAEKGRILLSRGYGMADLEWEIPNSAETRFRIGSLTKQFTAAAVLLLGERGKLGLDDPAGTFLEGAPKTWEKVTVRHLLTHTAGVPDITGFPGWREYKRQSHTPRESMALILGKPLDFEPGGKFQYSNSNYILLGGIIEKVSGMAWADFLQSNIFTPLGMRDTGAESPSDIVPRRARGYEAAEAGFRHADHISMDIPYAAGCLHSTVEDLLRWHQGLFGGKILSPASLSVMTSPNAGGYGMGLFIREGARHGLITHNGSIEGFDASLNYYPDRGLTIAVLGNVRTDAPDKIAELIGKVAWGERIVLNSDRRVVDVDPRVLAAYAGHYSAPPFGSTISVEGGALTATSPGGRKHVLHAESPTRFFLKEIDVQIEFVRDPVSGKITEFLMTQDGREKRVARD